MAFSLQLIKPNKAVAQFTELELGYSPFATSITNFAESSLNQVFTLGYSVHTPMNRMNSLTLSYVSGSNDNAFVMIDEEYGGLDLTAASQTFNAVRIAFTRSGFVIGGFDLPFDWYCSYGASYMFESSTYSVLFRDNYTSEALKNAEEPQKVSHLEFLIGTGFQYNFTRNIGLRAEMQVGYGTCFGSTRGLSASAFPKLSLCIKPDKLF